MRIPDKAQHGANFKQWTVDTLNAIIDYLNASRVRPGTGIMVDETPSGTLLKLDPRARGTTIQQIITGTPQEITATIDGGTASITLTGGTGSVNMVGAGSVSISENENGEIEIFGSTSGLSGSSYPKYNDPLWINPVPATGGNSYTAQFDGFLVGSVKQTDSSGSQPQMLFDSSIYVNVGGVWSDTSAEVWFPICFPLKTGHKVAFIDAGDCDWSEIYFVHST